MFVASERYLERFPAKWTPVRVKKTRQNKNLEPRSDSIGTETALGNESLPPSFRSRSNREMRPRILYQLTSPMHRTLGVEERDPSGWID